MTDVLNLALLAVNALNYSGSQLYPFYNQLLSQMGSVPLVYGGDLQMSGLRIYARDARMLTNGTSSSNSSLSMLYMEEQLWFSNGGWASAEVLTDRVYQVIGVTQRVNATVVFTGGSGTCSYQQLDGPVHVEWFA